MILTKYFENLSNIVPFVNLQTINSNNILVVLTKYLPTVLFFLKNNLLAQYKVLSCISGIDFLGNKYRFCVSYDLLSLRFINRLRIKTFLNEVSNVPSVVSIYLNANWWEREIWDLFGIFFENHPDLRRLLTDYGFEGYPMRKDFPLYGYVELRYDEHYKRILAEPLELSQEFRFFDFDNPW